MKLKYLALVTVTVTGVLLPSAAQALHWVKIAVSEDNMDFYLDTDSVKRRGNTVQYSTYGVFSQPDQNGVTSVKVFRSMNCATGDYQVLREIMYAGGSVVSDTKGSKVLVTVPGTVGEAAFKRVCRR